MAKRIKNPIEVRAIVYYGEDGHSIQSALVRYGVTCEHNLVEKREFELLHNPEVLNVVKDFTEEGLKQVDIHEGVAEEDSLLDYSPPA